jgi:hypothetical protein
MVKLKGYGRKTGKMLRYFPAVQRMRITKIAKFFTEKLPHVVTHLTFIREVPGSDLGRFTDSGILSSSQSLQANAEIIPQTGHYRFLPHTFQFIIQYHPVIRQNSF